MRRREQPIYRAVLILLLLGGGAVVAQDCNGNGIGDEAEIAAGGADDCNDNGIPDVCEGPRFGFSQTLEVSFVSATRASLSDDFDGNGIDDLAVGYFGGVSVRLSERSGDFEEFFEINSLIDTSNPIDWATGDIDGDGDVDLAVLEPNRVVVALNMGDGSFEAGPTVEVLGRFVEFDLADLSGDGSADVVASDTRNDVVKVIPTDPGGAFQEDVDYSAGNDPRTLAIADMDEDGTPDIIVANRISADLTLLFNDGAGGFPESVSVPGLGSQTQKLVVADFSGDGIPDVATGDREGVKVLLNEGNRVFSPPTPLLANSSIVGALGKGDLDGDGDADLVASFVRPPLTVVFVNGANGVFNAGTPLVLPVFSHVTVHDADVDGSGDLIITPGGSDTVSVAFNRQSDSMLPFEPRQTYSTVRPHTVDIVDLDGDGDLDIAQGHNSFQAVTVMLNDGNGAFTDRSIPTQSGGGGFTIGVPDLNGDGHPDIAAGSIARSSIFLYLNDGTAHFSFKGPAISVGPPWHVTYGDVDGNSTVDVVSTSQSASVVSILFNDGTGTIERVVEYRVGTAPRAAALADLDGDGDLDISTANRGADNVTILENDGFGIFASTITLPVTGGPNHIVAGDMDGDGFIDLVTGNEVQREASILWHAGGNQIEFLPAARVLVGIKPYSLIAVDLDDDGRLDIASVEEEGPEQRGSTGGLISVVLNQGRREFSQAEPFLTGSGPRFIVAGDFDADLDVDVLSVNRRSGDISVFLNELATAGIPDFLESVCTPGDYFSLSVQPRSVSSVRRIGKYVLAARDDPNLHPALFQNVNRFRLHEDFLAAVFPDEFGFVLEDRARYLDLIGRRTSRDYFVGTVDLRQRDDGFIYTFNVVVDTGFDPREVLSQEETREVYNRLRTHFLIGPLAYSPGSQSELEAAESWVDPDFPVFIDDAPPTFQFEAYTLGLGYGRLRIMTLEEFEVANRAGRFTFQDGVVIEEVSPPDIEGVVGFVFTGGVQGELAHLPIRTARRGTPNAFVSNVREKFREFNGELVRVEVFPENFFVTRVDADEAEDFWNQIRRELPERPFLDLGYSLVDGFLEMDLMGRPVGRYGGKATNLGRLQRVILNNGALDNFLEPGFGIPSYYYRAFMQSNFRGAQTLEEYIQEIVAREDVRTDSNLRFEVLEEFRSFARANSTVDPDLVQSLALKIESVFGDLATMVRFRSSSNVEDALVFNGAGLYESTSVCALDSLDANDRNSSHCDVSRTSERTIERALKKVWTSLWTFRAHEERTFYQIDPNDAVMAIAVTRAFLDEDANGVAFTGSPRDAEDKRYIITAQVGEGSVVSPPAGTTVERTLLEVGHGGVVENIIRSRASNQVEPGVVVMKEDHLHELARFMWQIENAWQFNLPEDVSREQVILDFEFKVEPGGSLAVKQVRPFLIPTPDLRTPTFELEIPVGTTLCGVFAPERVARRLDLAQPELEYEMKSQIRLNSGVFELPSDEESFTRDLIAELRFGPEQEIAQPIGEGRFEFSTVPVEGSETKYTFRYSQEFSLTNGSILNVEIDKLEYSGRGSIALQRRVVLDDFYNTFSLQMRANLDGEPRVAYSSCNYAEIPRWEIEVELDGGSRLSFVERFEAEETVRMTARASLVSATVDIDGQRRDVNDYWSLIYSSIRHNVDVVYWVLLEPALDLTGVEQPVRVVELSGFNGLRDMRYECSTATVSYLDDDFNVIGTPTLVSCVKEARADPGPVFQRGDLGDGSVTVADAIQVLRYLFERGSTPSCLSSADANDDGRVDVSDAVGIILHLFGGVSTLPAPFGECGTDPTPDELSCVSSEACSG